MRKAILRAITKAPQKPGVYIFYGKNKKPLYIGKASWLKNRLKSYLKVRDFKTRLLHEQAYKLKCIPLRSDIEALIEEARMIKTAKPHYNVMMRDDKSYFYVAFTKEKFPRVFITHKLNHKRSMLNADLVGPFTDGTALKKTLRLLRRSFPYCTCVHAHHRICINAQIGNCPSFCCAVGNVTNRQSWQYRKTINVLKSILRGNTKKLNQKEIAPESWRALNNVLAHKNFLENENDAGNGDFMPHIKRIEGYDISHLSGKEAVGVMTALIKKGGQFDADKNEWRKFRIKSAGKSDDPGAVAEILERRMRHPEWKYPELVIIDGGIAQYNAAKEVLRSLNLKSGAPSPRLISFAKPHQLVFGLGKKPLPLSALEIQLQNVILKVIRQTHDFAVRYHRKRRALDFLPAGKMAYN